MSADGVNDEDAAFLLGRTQKIIAKLDAQDSVTSIELLVYQELMVSQSPTALRAMSARLKALSQEASDASATKLRELLPSFSWSPPTVTPDEIEADLARANRDNLVVSVDLEPLAGFGASWQGLEVRGWVEARTNGSWWITNGAGGAAAQTGRDPIEGNIIPTAVSCCMARDS